MSDTAVARVPHRFLAQKSFINWWSTKFWLYDEFGMLRFWRKQKAGRLREHIDTFAGNETSSPGS